MKRKLISESIGTYFLVFAGTGAIVINHLTGSLTHVGIAITFGLVVTVMIYTFGHISGAHFNPAVTAAFWLRGDISAKDALLYIVTQVISGIAASMTLRALFGNVEDLGATLPRSSWEQSFILESILTFILMMVILGSAVHGKAVKSFAGIAIGGTVGLEAMFAGPITGASMNPARSIAPALVSGNLDYWWVYVISTAAGAILAAYVYNFLHE